ncbi:hypothetical protein KTS45_19090 [Halomicroarcula limicola]|uniref:Uncharacterized protein n=1 Tax=Haloarcula limicola TaxID=1429915 RepID=A0A8J7YH11_9EURY|nr:hypothetical protein [Halomicroarcula limicola]MBV0926318.1 hypothetical protein [Halomicroarcula limicola]
MSQDIVGADSVDFDKEPLVTHRRPFGGVHEHAIEAHSWFIPLEVLNVAV